MGAVRGVVVAGMTLASVVGMSAPAWAAPEKQPVTPQQCEDSNGTVQRADDGVGTCVGGSRYDGHIIEDVSTTPQAADQQSAQPAQPGATTAPAPAYAPAPGYAPAPPGYYYSAPPAAYGPAPAPQAAPAAPAQSAPQSGPQRATAPAQADEADETGADTDAGTDTEDEGSDD